jgi:diguanylate cyclase (GGDEF)-like protein
MSELIHNGIYEMIFNTVSDMVFIMEVSEGPTFKYVMANAKAIEHAKLASDFYGKTIQEILPEDVAEGLINHYENALKTNGEYVFEDYVQSPTNSFYGESKLSVYNDVNLNKTFIISITRDVTTRKKYEEKLKKLAYEDFLTGLANRRVFDDKLEKTLSSIQQKDEKNIALFLLDIDYFKEINDKYGHNTGDHYLKRTADILKSSINEEQATVARIGGDEFAILIEVENKDEARNIAEQILLNSNQKIKIKGHKLNFSISIGIALGHDKVRGKKLKKEADEALYEAKENGRNQFRFYL